MFFYKFFQILLYLPLRILYPTRVYGKKNLVSGGAIFMCNHQSNADVLVLGTCIWRKQHFLAKKELWQNKFLKFFLNLIKAIPINRQSVEISSIKRCLQVLKQEKVLTIFPQGTRKANNELTELKSGVIVFASKTKKPIIPIFIEKKPRIFKMNKMYIGKPIYLSELYDCKPTEKQLIDAENKIIETYKNLSLKQVN